MAQRPISYPSWVQSGSNVIQPPAELAQTGYLPGQAPDSQNFNWLFGEYDAWIEYLDQLTTAGLPQSVIRLLNGGNWSFEVSSSTLAWSANANLAIPPLPDASNVLAAGSVVIADGQVAYLQANVPSFSLGNTSTTSNQNKITQLNFTGNISTGDGVSGPGIPDGTTVLGVDSDSVTLSQNVTSNNVQQTYIFYSLGSLSLVVANETSFQPTINTILLARRAANVIYLGVNCTQMVLRDQETKTLNSQGYFSVYAAPAGQNIAAGTLCYISPGSGDAGRTQGSLYPLDVSSANEAIRGVYAGVVITAVTTGNTATVVYSGFFNEVGLTAGAVYYADPTNPGSITPVQPNSAGSKITPVGFAVTTSILLLTGVASSQPLIPFPVFAEDEFAANGQQTVFPLSKTALNAAGILVFIDGLVIPSNLWSFSANSVTFNTAPVAAQSIEFKYLIASQAYVACGQELATNPSEDRQTWVLTGVPVNQPSTYVFVDGIIIPSALWTLEIGGTANKVIFNAPLGIGQIPYVAYFTTAASLPAGGGGGGGTVTGAENVGSGVGVFNALSGTVLDFNSLIAGINVTITPNGIGGIVISASAAIGVTGSFAAPSQIVPSAGFTPRVTSDQVAFLAPLSGGATPVTANPQILAGTIGDRLTLKGTSASNYYSFVDGNGLSLNGPLFLTDNQACELIYDGTQWSENSRRM